jgi:hypothetical protein
MVMKASRRHLEGIRRPVDGMLGPRISTSAAEVASDVKILMGSFAKEFRTVRLWGLVEG